MNNRPIKFRIWDIIDKKFSYFQLPDKNVVGISYFNYSSRQIYQQFTGLKDKTGREIYEGDIVSVLDENNVFEVKFGRVERNIVGFDTNTIFPVELNAFYFEKDGLPYFSITDNYLGKHDIEDTIIIGNIFKNKELLL